MLTGGSGKDKFYFDTPMDGSVDRITDFNVADDTILLDNAIYTSLGSGTLSSPQRISGTNFERGNGVSANDADDYILYDTATGMLSYDADGNGSGAAVAIVQLDAGLDIAKYDILVF